MKTAVLVYNSSTGFTKKYAQWIQEELNCTTVELKDADISEIIKYDIIIFGGGIHANKINGIKFIKNNLEILKNKDLIIFATGATPAAATDQVKQFEQANIPSGCNIPFFYFHSGMNYKDMRMGDKLIMKGLKFILSVKKDKTPAEQGTAEAISSSYDNTNQIFIKPLINYVRGLLD